MAQLGLAPLSALGLEALAARVIFRARQENDLAYFNPVANLPGFPRALAKTLRDLRLAGITPDRLVGVGAPTDDLAKLLSRYEAELAERKLADMAAIFRLATEAATGSHRWSGLPVVLLDLDLPSQAHRDLFNKLATRAPELLIAVNKAANDENFPGKQIGLAPNDNVDLDGESPENALDHLRRNLFNPAATPFSTSSTGLDSFEYFSAPGEGLEAVEIARRILRMGREGVAFDDIALLLRNPERYQPMIDDALRRAAIPAYFSQGTTRPDPSGRAFLAVLGCAAENLSATRFAEYLSLGQLPGLRAANTEGDPWVGPSDELLSSSTTESPTEVALPENATPPTPRGWEKLLVDAAVIGGRDRWERRLNGLEAEWQLQLKDQSDPEAAVRQQERLERLRNLRGFALPVIGALADLPKSAIWSDWLTQLSSLADQCLRDPTGVLALLADLAPMGEVGPATLEEVVEVLSDRLQFLRREPPARRWGQVFVGSVDEVRASDFRVVFLPGLAEGLFPQKSLEDPLMLDEFRKIVNELDGALALRNDLVRAERLRLHIAVGAARERLIASYPRMEVAEARPRVPSFYALELPRAIFGAIPELSQFERQAREAAPARLNWPAPREAQDAIDDAEYDLVTIAQARNPDAAASRAHYLTVANPHLIRSLRGRWARWHKSWRPADGLVTADPGALAALEAYRLTARAWSPSALETFSSCPYKFALRGIYRLRPREDSTPLEQLDPMTRGSLFHAVQFELFQQLKSVGLLPVTPSNLADAISRCDRALQQISDEYAEKLAPAIPRVWDSEMEDLRTDLRGWLSFIATNETSWTPTYFERDFGFDSELSLTEGVRLHGRIDLLEQSNINPSSWRVTDHKTGKRPETVPRWVGGGKSLQPLLYALAAEQFLSETSGEPATVESGRLLYATQKGQYTPIEIRLDDRARQFVAKLLGNIDGSISGGFLPPIPDKDVCGFCDYRIVCGPYEERRLLKKDRRDDRLDTLYEIRSMA